MVYVIEITIYLPSFTKMEHVLGFVKVDVIEIMIFLS
jgi:hypothetical protein